jgi:hypothetical protein
VSLGQEGPEGTEAVIAWCPTRTNISAQSADTTHLTLPSLNSALLSNAAAQCIMEARRKESFLDLSDLISQSRSEVFT